MNKFKTNQRAATLQDIQEIFVDFLNDKLLCSHVTTWDYAEGRKDTIVLKSNNTVYTNGTSKFENISFIKDGQEIYTDCKYLLKSDAGDEMSKSIDIGCFEDFFAVIDFRLDTVDHKSFRSVTLNAYSYTGKHIAELETESVIFDNFYPREIFELKNKVKNLISEESSAPQRI